MKKANKSKNVVVMWIAYAVMWIAVSVAVIAGLFITKSAWCLWAFIVPANIRFKSKTNDEESDDDLF